jgi:hypothetical protein
MKKAGLIGSLIALLPFVGFAHEGHGHTHGFTITHYFVEPEHLFVLMAVISAGILLFRRYYKRTKRAD